MKEHIKKIVGEHAELLKIVVIFSAVVAMFAGLKVIVGSQVTRKLFHHSTESNDHWVITNSIVNINK